MKLMQRIFVEKRLAITIVIIAVVIDIALYALLVLPRSVALTNARQRAEVASSGLIAAEESNVENDHGTNCHSSCIDDRQLQHETFGCTSDVRI